MTTITSSRSLNLKNLQLSSAGYGATKSSQLYSAEP